MKKQNEIKIGDHVLATKWHDGDPNDHWAMGRVTEIIRDSDNVRYMIADIMGQNIRGGGFRRAQKISSARSQWIWDRQKTFESSGKSIWWWARQKMC